jgi:hypothetical protein
MSQVRQVKYGMNAGLADYFLHPLQKSARYFIGTNQWVFCLHDFVIAPSEKFSYVRLITSGSSSSMVCIAYQNYSS